MRRIWIVVAAVLLMALVIAVWPVSPSYRDGFAQESQRAQARHADAVAAQVDWQTLQEQATQDLQTYIRLNTTNPPGSERAAANWLAGRLVAEGIEATVEEAAPGRFNLVARLPGRDRTAPILLVSHMDVVPADASPWRHDPFGGDLVDGEVWGRGALDDKGPEIMQLYALIALKRAGVRLDHDIILIAVADEEAGGYQGMKALLDRHPEWIQAAFAVLGEPVGRMQVMGANVLVVGAAKKGQVALHVTLEGQGGHASSPAADQALPQLAAGMQRVNQAKQKGTIDPITQEGFGRVGARMGGIQGWLLQHLSWAPVRWLVLPVMSKDAGIAAMLHNTFAWTSLQSGDKFNVIPTRAEAMLDMRIMPGESAATVKQWIQESLALAGAHLDELVMVDSTRSEIRTDAFAMLEAVIGERYPDTVVSPQLLSYGSDARYLRQVGIPSYVVTPATLSRELTDRVHGNDERIPAAGSGKGLATSSHGWWQLQAINSRRRAPGTPAPRPCVRGELLQKKLYCALTFQKNL